VREQLAPEPLGLAGELPAVRCRGCPLRHHQPPWL
jgi:hypothetical protein